MFIVSGNKRTGDFDSILLTEDNLKKVLSRSKRYFKKITSIIYFVL